MKHKKEFNFARRWELEQAKLTAPTSALPLAIIAWGIGGTVVVLAIAGSPWLWEYKLAYDLQSVNQKIVALRPVEIQVQTMNEFKSKIQSSKQFLDLVRKENRDPIEVLDKLKQLLPVGTMVNSFSYTGDSINIAVSIPLPVDVARLWVSLRDSGIFQNVDIQSVSLVDKVQKLNFTLQYNPKADVKYPVFLTQSDSEQSNSGQASPEPPTKEDNNNYTSTNSNAETSIESEKDKILYPGIPIGLVAIPSSSSRIDLSWNPAKYASTYNVYRSTSLKGEYRKVVNVKEPKYMDTELAPGTAYYYKISSLKSTGVEGYFDNPVGTVTFDLDTPTGFKANAGSGKIELIWNPVNGATAFKIYRASGSDSFSFITTVSGTNYIDMGLPVGIYRYKINAIADNITGGTTEPISADLSN